MADLASGKPALKWYQGLERYCWIVLVISALGWLFDTMDQNLFNMVRNASLRDILRPIHQVDSLPADVVQTVTNETRVKATTAEQSSPAALAQATTENLKKAAEARLEGDVKAKSGSITAIFLIGWATGGFIFGVLGDRIGRTKTMILTILIYALFTGLSGLTHTFFWYAFTRFMTGLGVGGEWAAGAALVAETFPARSRPMALGLLQALSTVGNMMAAVITLIIGDLDLSRWRVAYFIGAVPALLVLWIRRSVREPEAWVAARQHKTAKEMGSVGDLFRHKVLRRHTIAACLMATAGVGALWGVAFFAPDMIGGELRKAGATGKEIGRLTSISFLIQQAGAFCGIYSFALFAEKFNRRSAFFLWFLLAWGAILAFFWGIAGSGSGAFSRSLILAPIMGFCTLGPFCGYSIYFPELFPTRLRATGCGFCYNIARYLAALAPFALGGFAQKMGGYAPAATIVSCVFLLGFVGLLIGPETRGKPLPEDADFEIALPGAVLAGAK